MGIRNILKSADKLEEFSLGDLSVLLNVKTGSEAYSNILAAADRIKKETLGTKVYLPVPLYISNYCQNRCLYCANRVGNTSLKRKRLTKDEISKEIDALIEDGFRIIELVFGDDPALSTENVVEYVEVLKRKLGNVSGGLIALNAKPLQTKDYALLNKAGVDIVVNWQETYNKERFADIHPRNTPKANYTFRVAAQERMLKAGMKNVGVGILFGLYSFKQDVISLVKHGRRLAKKYNITPIIGIPRLKTAKGQKYTSPKYDVGDNQLQLAVAVLRLALPYSHIFVSTRENKQLAFKLLKKGGGNIFASKCSVFPGGYTTESRPKDGQFEVFSYNTKEIREDLEDMDYKPTFASHPNYFNFEE